MKVLILLLAVLINSSLLGQSPDYGDGNTRVVYNLGAGLSSLAGIAAISDLGINYNRNLFAWRFHFSSELSANTGKTSDNDFFLDFGTTYGRMKEIKNDWFIDFNVGPSLYLYTNRLNTSSSGMYSLGGSTKKTTTYFGVGGLVHVDVGKDFSKRLGVEFSIFMNINANYPMGGLAACFALRNDPTK